MATTTELAFSVLVVDDESDARTILRGELEKLPGISLKVATAGDGDEALNKLKDTAFDPLTVGITVLTVGVPSGFASPSNLRLITATVN
jgi:CheY-like chemotaxis protein